MTQDEGDHSNNNFLLDAVRKVCDEMSIAFSANDANQALADVSRSDDVDPMRLLNAVGQSVGVRFREMNTSLRDLLLTVHESVPVVIEQPGSREHDLLVVLRSKGRSRFVVHVNGTQKTVSQGWLKRNSLDRKNGTCRWYRAEPMFSADDASAYNYQTGTYGKPLSPLNRLFAFLKPESKDIRTVAVFAVFVGILSLTTPLAVEALVNTIVFGQYLQPLIVLSLMVFVFLAFSAGLQILMMVVVEIMQRRLFVRVVDDLAFRLTRVPVAFLKIKHGTELVNRFFDVVNIQKISSKLLLSTLLTLLQTVIGLAVLAFYHPLLLGYDIGLIALMIIALFAMGKGAAKTAMKESALKYETAAWLQEIVRHPTTFKFNGGLGFAINRADELSAKYIQSRHDHFRILIRQVTFSMMMQAVAATVLLGLGGFLVIEGELTLGQLVAAELIVTVILGSLAKVGKDLESFYDLLASVDKLGKLFDLPGEPANKLRLGRQDGPTTINLVNLKFLNTTGEAVRAEIRPGTSVAIVGKSGSGKTKVIETIAGLHSPVDGYVMVNQSRVDLLGVESLQTQIGFINQIEIFEGTVEENLRLGRSEIDSASINFILEKLDLHDTITSLDDGYKTELSISGFPLSTGQAIRLVLARALIARPPALLIDDLLDRLADDDVGDILQRLDEFKTTTTIVIATGRNAIAAWADQRVEV